MMREIAVAYSMKSISIGEVFIYMKLFIHFTPQASEYSSGRIPSKTTKTFYDCKKSKRRR